MIGSAISCRLLRSSSPGRQVMSACSKQFQWQMALTLMDELRGDKKMVSKKVSEHGMILQFLRVPKKSVFLCLKKYVFFITTNINKLYTKINLKISDLQLFSRNPVPVTVRTTTSLVKHHRARSRGAARFGGAGCRVQCHGQGPSMAEDFGSAEAEMLRCAEICWM